MPQSLSQLITSLKLDYCNPYISEANFPATGRRSTDYKLFCFDHSIESEEVIEKMEEKGYEPADIYELLKWAKENWNGKDWVVALGSVWQHLYGYRDVPCLDRDGYERSLNLYWFGGRWGGSFRFLAVKVASELDTSDTLSLESRLSAFEEFNKRLKKVFL